MIFAKKLDPDTQNVGPDLKSKFIDTQIVISKYLDVSNGFLQMLKDYKDIKSTQLAKS